MDPLTGYENVLQEGEKSQIMMGGPSMGLGGPYMRLIMPWSREELRQDRQIDGFIEILYHNHYRSI